ncbi:receptor-type tyrosine-protein phosphatase eta [Heteronotia binoei]|uniref:receptor-type tyrosine-protein phosphatase eta n=1 Tax=Heteronotia binoei TaxID=13085 RepID=UPI00292DA59C|nr:receptor-type tyrosine-protein phosphatase eta [Heteronotia binoei]
MRQLAQLFPLLVLCLNQIKVLAACDECSSVNVTATNTEIHIQTPNNFTISNVTFSNGIEAKPGPLTESISDLEPGVQYIVYLQNNQNITEICCKNITTVPTSVIDIQFSNITTTTINLTWNSRDQNAPNYIYRIVVDGNGTNRTENSNVMTAVISNLEPGTLYTFTIYPEVARTVGDANNGSAYTKPNAVSDIYIENINSTTVNLRWNNSDTNSATYTYRICFEKNGTEMEEFASGTSTTIGDLEPGTWYTFTIFPRVNVTEGDPKNASIYTKPSPVTDIHCSSITTQAVNLMWTSSDRNAANYRYKIIVDGDDSSRMENSSETTAVISGLEPGTLYTFTIYPLVAEVEGDPKNISTYTKPSPVMYIHFSNITTQAVSLMWNSSDRNAANYRYRITIDGAGSSRTENSSETTAIISSLEPGTLYTFTIYPLVADMEGDPRNRSTYTKPSPVMYIHFSNITTQAVSLMWNISDRNAANYRYRIMIDGDGSSRTENSSETTAIISSLEPGTLYTFTIYPLVADMEGDPRNRSTYTKPSPVMYIHFSNITTQAVSLMWNISDRNAANYRYRIIIDGDGSSRTENSSETTAIISSLEPGTLYTFTIYPLVADMEGDPRNRSTYTIPSSVFNITATDISSVAVDLSWVNTDVASWTYSYRIHIRRENGTYKDKIVRSTNATVSQLTPGVKYTISIYSVAADNTTEGNPDSISLFTKPSAVSHITVKNIGITEVTLSWSIEDAAASGYTYKIYIENVNSTGKNITEITPSKTAVIRELEPGTAYNFSVFAQVNSGKTEGDSRSLSVCTVAAQVTKLSCMPVPKQPELNLSWTPPDGTYNSFIIEILNGTSNRMEHCSSEDQGVIIKDLRYFASYTVKIVTHSCGEMSVPQEKKCLTSITDPPVPFKEPTLEATSHNSLKVQFSPFSSIYGPLKAYAIIITSKGLNCSSVSLTDTYQNFTKKNTDSYVAYVKNVQNSSNIDCYDIEIGDGSTYRGYFNGKLEPLSSYRACVAGFTHIVFTNDFISSKESYASFSKFSGSVTLPQNPDVITGAVVGCILGAALVAAIVVFIFWKKRRKDGKNNEVPFSPIIPKKSKLIKVENFESYFKKQKADSNCGFAEEYEDLRPVGVNQPKFAAELPENKGKNRYNNVLPYDVSRVKLSAQNHPTNDYINANYVPGYSSKKEFIAAQGSLPNTVQDFWRMIWEKNIHTIVMLTKCIEQGRTKCEEYWPNKQSKNYGDLTVAMTSEIILPEWTIRDFSMEKSDASISCPVRQFHFTAWPDHGVPETTDLLISFRHLVQDYMKQNPPTPTLVHCSAGVGRTGTFIAIDRLIHQMEMENTVDVYGVVYDLRMHRPLMVQTEEQYVFLNQCVMDIIKSKKEKKADLIYQNTNAMAIYENFKPSPHLGKANGYHM